MVLQIHNYLQGLVYWVSVIYINCLFFEDFKNEAFNMYHPWHLFQMTELTEIMRRKNDQPFTELLNRFRTASQTDEDIQSIQSRSMNPLDNNYPLDVLHTWAENIPITNKTMQNYNLRDPCFS